MWRTIQSILRGTIIHNTGNGFIWAENQVSLGASETLMTNEYFE